MMEDFHVLNQEVEWKTINEICKSISSGGTPLTTKQEYYNGNIPWLRTQEVDWKDIYETSLNITDEGLKNSSAKMIPENCIIVAMYGATAAKVAINKIKLTTNQACCNLSINERIANYKFVYYWLCHQYTKLKSLGEGSQSNINSQKIKTFPIPIPPLPIQQEIVNILDKFTQLEAELEAELEARRIQYEYYMNELFGFEDDKVKWKALGDFAAFKYGYTDKALEKGDARFIRITDINENGYLIPKNPKFINVTEKNKEYLLKVNDLIVARTGATYGKTLLIKNDEPAIYASYLIKIKLDNSIILNDYYWHFSKSSYYWKQAKSFVSSGGQPQFNANVLCKILVPIPSITKQREIVKLLDKFDKLVNDLSYGLPAEIEIRRKQYEYYRNKLLSFKPLNHG